MDEVIDDIISMQSNYDDIQGYIDPIQMPNTVSEAKPSINFNFGQVQLKNFCANKLPFLKMIFKLFFIIKTGGKVYKFWKKSASTTLGWL